ncbi:MAG TPA: TlpA disulfide reductase family protein [Acidimicrobiia bacterium]
MPNRGGRLALLFVLVIAVGAGIGLAVRAARDNVRQIEQAQTLTDSLGALPKGPQAGEPAPNFTLELFDGSTFDLSEHLASDGRPVLLNFWYPSCPPCRAEMPALDQVARATPEVLFLGVGVPILDTKEDAIAFSEEIGVSYPIGWDETEAVSALYPTLGYPTTFIVGSDGTIIRQFIGIVSAEWLTELLAQDLNL